MSLLRRAIIAGGAAPSPPAPACAVTLESPGIFGEFGAGAMDIDGQTATNPDGALRAAHTATTVTPPAADDAIFIEWHYDPADWSGAEGSNGVGVGDPTLGDALDVDLSGPVGQGNNALLFAVRNDGGTVGAAVYNSAGQLVDSRSLASVDEFYAYVFSSYAGGTVKFVTDPEQFVVPNPGPTGTSFDWCGDEIPS